MANFRKNCVILCGITVLYIISLNTGLANGKDLASKRSDGSEWPKNAQRNPKLEAYMKALNKLQSLKKQYYQLLSNSSPDSLNVMRHATVKQEFERLIKQAQVDLNKAWQAFN